MANKDTHTFIATALAAGALLNPTVARAQQPNTMPPAQPQTSAATAPSTAAYSATELAAALNQSKDATSLTWEVKDNEVVTHLSGAKARNLKHALSQGAIGHVTITKDNIELARSYGLLGSMPYSLRDGKNGDETVALDVQKISRLDVVTYTEFAPAIRDAADGKWSDLNDADGSLHNVLAAEQKRLQTEAIPDEPQRPEIHAANQTKEFPGTKQTAAGTAGAIPDTLTLENATTEEAVKAVKLAKFLNKSDDKTGLTWQANVDGTITSELLPKAVEAMQTFAGKIQQSITVNGKPQLGTPLSFAGTADITLVKSPFGTTSLRINASDMSGAQDSTYVESAAAIKEAVNGHLPEAIREFESLYSELVKPYMVSTINDKTIVDKLSSLRLPQTRR